MIRFKYQPTLPDYLALNRRVLIQAFGKLVWIAVALLLLFLILPFLSLLSGSGHTVGGIYLSGIALLILPAILAFTFVATLFSARRRWRDAGEIRSERSYEIDEKGISVVGTTFSGFIEWSHIRAVDFRGGFVFMKTAQNQFYFFPERLIQDSSALRELVKKHVSRENPRRLILGMPIPVLVWLIIIAIVVAMFFIPPVHK